MQRKAKHPLRVTREAHNLTQQQLAGALRIGLATIKRAESGQGIGLDSRQRLCSYFGLSAEELGLTKNEGEEGMSITLISTQDALAHYVEQQRRRIMSSLAPGSVGLRVGEIVEGNGLFIPPAWRLCAGLTPDQPLTNFLLYSLPQGHCVLLLGEAGGGKTTILKRIFALLAEQFLTDSSLPLPLYIPLREYQHTSENALNTLWNHLQAELPLSREAFTSLARSGQIIFLFDGFDEIPGPITQQAINQRAAWNMFKLPSLLSCRKGFFDFYLSMTPLLEAYPEQVELQPLQVFGDDVALYIAAFCRQRMAHTSESQIFLIIETIRQSPELQDLAQRPLLLLMILEVFTSSKVLETRWSIAELYRQYTERWLKHEAAKPDATLKWYEKAALLQEIAWQSSIESSHTVFSLEELHTYTQNSVSRYLGRTESQIFDDLCFRTLLSIAEESNYAFLHKSFQEYFAARYVYSCIHRRNDPNGVDQVLRTSLPHDIATFLKKMLRESEPHEKSLMAANLIDAYQRNQEPGRERATIRQQSTYYLSNLRTELAARFLKSIYQQEPNRWVARGIMVGLILYFDQADILEQYIDILHNDSAAAAVNIRYHLIYYGDQDQPDSLEALEALDTITHSEKTVAALLRHLQSNQYRNGWAIDLFTLSNLLEQQSISILHTHAWYLPFLKDFLGKDHPGHSIAFPQEQKRLKQLIKGEPIGQR